MMFQELSAKAVMAAVSGRPSTGPKDILFAKWRENWNCIMEEVLWTAIGEEGNFSSFKFEGVNLASIDTEALAKVATKASKISLCNTSLTADQVNALAIALATNSQIQEVDLSDNFLTDINPEMLARAVARTRKLSLVNTGLTTDQVNQLLESLLSEASIMEDLDLSANILSFIEPDLMAHSLNKLKMVTLLDSAVSVNQVW